MQTCAIILRKQGQLNSPLPQNRKLSTQTILRLVQNTEIPKIKNYLRSNAVFTTLRMESKDKGKEEEDKLCFLHPFKKTKPPQIKVYTVLKLVFNSTHRLLFAIQNGER